MEHTFLKNQRRWKCKACRRQYSVKVGTIFEDSPIPLGKWLTAMWLVANAKNGVSSYEVHRAIGVTQKTAWFMLQRIRLAMQEEPLEPLSGHVEADETFVGGRRKNKHVNKKDAAARGAGDKAVVLGLLERGGNVRTFVVAHTGKSILRGILLQNVQRGATLHTDGGRGYEGLEPFYTRHTVDHPSEYVRGIAHINTIEAYWTLLKRTIKGTYVCPSPWHLHRYCDEQAWRFNNRKMKDGDRMERVAESTPGKRIKYATLIRQRDGL